MMRKVGENGMLLLMKSLKAMEEYRTQCDELPGDDVVNKQAKVSCKGNSHAMRYHHMLEQFREGAKWMRSLASPAIASRDSRIRELEEALKDSQIIMKNLKHTAKDSSAPIYFGGVSLDKALDTNWQLIKSIKPPTQAEG
jgi:hypothetical protein